MRRDSISSYQDPTSIQSIYQSFIPVGEVQEIPFDEGGLEQFNLAVKLFDIAYYEKSISHMRNREQGE